MNTNELLSTIEKARRAEDYKSMNVATETLNMRLEGDTSPDAWATRSKMTYELHMAAYQQSKSSRNSRRQRRERPAMLPASSSRR